MTLLEKVLKIAPKSLCKPAMKYLKGINTPKEFLEYYKFGIDFCFDNNFPNAEFLKQEAGSILVENGFYIDAKEKIKEAKYIVSLGKSELDINIKAYEVVQVFAKDSSILNITAKDNSYLMVDLFGETKAYITATENARVTINIYGKAKAKTNVVNLANVVLNKKNSDKYI